MSIKLRIALAAAAAGMLSVLVPVGGSPAVAGQCDQNVYVFSQTGVIFDQPIDDPQGGQIYHQGNPTRVTNEIGCLASPDVEFNSNFIYPGSNILSSRLLAGNATTYHFAGALAGASGDVIRGRSTTGRVTDPNLTFIQSRPVAVSPASLGCQDAWFNDGGSGATYCTLESLTP
ncbi:MAG TPA: hypothetical protein VNE62_13275 [Actinomycetota bacterium]|nr:hypothetical protein [Actinomycetota bacterium]